MFEAVAGGLMILTIGTAVWYVWEKRQRVTHPMKGGLHPNIALPYTDEFELYHNDLSLCSKKVRVCLSELELSYKAHHIDLIETGSYETISRHFLKVNPAGILPVLLHNGHPIYESHDIIEYAAAHCADGNKQLVPADPHKKALMQEWMKSASIVGDDPTQDLTKSAAGCVSVLTVPLFAAGIASIPYRKILVGILFHRLKVRPFLFLMLKVVGLERLFSIGRVTKKLDEAKAAFTGHLAKLDDLLSDGRPYIVGQDFSLADISWMVLFDRLVEADLIDGFLGGDTFPYVQQYWNRLRNRPSFVEGVDGFRHPLVVAATRCIQALKTRDKKFKIDMARGCPVVAPIG